MNLLIKIALDYPAKAEKIFLWILQALIICWILSFVPEISLSNCLFTSSTSLISEDCLKQISALKIATYLSLFTVCWIIIWGAFADIIVKFLFKRLEWVLDKIVRVLLFITILIPVYIYQYIKSSIKGLEKPETIWNFKEYKINYNENYQDRIEVNESLKFFFKLDNSLDSNYGTELLLTILLHEETDFVKSRVIRYFSIWIVMLVANYSVGNHGSFSWIYSLLIFISVLIGLIIFKLNDVFSKLTDGMKHDLIPKLEFNSYFRTVYQAIKDSKLMDIYDVERKRRFLLLKKRDSLKDISPLDRYCKCLEIIPFSTDFVQIKEIVKHLKKGNNKLTILVSDYVPEIWEENSLSSNGVCYIHAEVEEDIHFGIDELKPFYFKNNSL